MQVLILVRHLEYSDVNKTLENKKIELWLPFVSGIPTI